MIQLNGQSFTDELHPLLIYRRFGVGGFNVNVHLGLLYQHLVRAELFTIG